MLTSEMRLKMTKEESVTEEKKLYDTGRMVLLSMLMVPVRNDTRLKPPPTMVF